MNKERIFDKVNEYGEAYGDYKRASEKYRKNHHGFGAFFDYRNGMTDEVRHLVYLDEAQRGAWYTMTALYEVLELDKEQIARLDIASRFLRRWYERTEWQFCPSRELIDRLWKFVEG